MATDMVCILLFWLQNYVDCGNFAQAKLNYSSPSTDHSIIRLRPAVLPLSVCPLIVRVVFISVDQRANMCSCDADRKDLRPGH
jgi:hypothetical protein